MVSYSTNGKTQSFCYFSLTPFISSSRNDRRIRYFSATFNSSPTKRTEVLIMDPPESSSKVTASNHYEEHIYSQDPLMKEKDEDTLLYEHIDDELFDQKIKSKPSDV